MEFMTTKYGRTLPIRLGHAGKWQRRKRPMHAKAVPDTHDKIWNDAYYLKAESGSSTVGQIGEIWHRYRVKNTAHNRMFWQIVCYFYGKNVIFNIFYILRIEILLNKGSTVSVWQGVRPSWKLLEAYVDENFRTVLYRKIKETTNLHLLSML